MQWHSYREPQDDSTSDGHLQLHLTGLNKSDGLDYSHHLRLSLLFQTILLNSSLRQGVAPAVELVLGYDRSLHLPDPGQAIPV